MAVAHLHVGVSMAVVVLAFHTPIGFPWSLNLFAAVSVMWIEREIRFYRREGCPVFESLGEASYSIYLTHVHGAALWYALPLVALLGPWLNWAGALVSVVAFAASFYWLSKAVTPVSAAA